MLLLLEAVGRQIGTAAPRRLRDRPQRRRALNAAMATCEGLRAAGLNVLDAPAATAFNWFSSADLDEGRVTPSSARTN